MINKCLYLEVSTRLLYHNAAMRMMWKKVIPIVPIEWAETSKTHWSQNEPCTTYSMYYYTVKAEALPRW